MNIREIITSLQEDKKEHTASKAFDEGFNYGADNAIDKLKKLEGDIKQKMLNDYTTPVRKLLLDILGEEEGYYV